MTNVRRTDDKNQIFIVCLYLTTFFRAVYNSSDQFFYMKPLNTEANNIITSLDFFELANMNMSVPGFGKADFVEYFLEKKSTLK